MAKAKLRIKTDQLSGGEVAAVLVGVMLASVVAFFLWAWLVMLVIGALHAEVAASIPALSYWASCLVTLALSIVGSFFHK